MKPGIMVHNSASLPILADSCFMGGGFLRGVLTDFWKRHGDETSFIQDNRMRSGGKAVLHPGFQLRWTNKTTIAADDVLKWAGFKQILRKWHRKLAKVSHEPAVL